MGTCITQSLSSSFALFKRDMSGKHSYVSAEPIGHHLLCSGNEKEGPFSCFEQKKKKSFLRPQSFSAEKFSLNKIIIPSKRQGSLPLALSLLLFYTKMLANV